MLVTRSLGSYQYLTVQESISFYWNRKYYLGFLVETIEAKPDNILTNTVFYAMDCLEFIAITRVYAIIHVSICLPMKFLAGKSDEFENWSCRKMGKAIDLLEQKLIVLSQIQHKFLDYNFMIVKIFNKIKIMFHLYKYIQQRPLKRKLVLPSTRPITLLQNTTIQK